MTTVKTKLRPSTVAGRPGNIIFFVTHHRVVRQISTGYKVFPCEWDARGMTVLFPSGCGESRSGYLTMLDDAIREDIRRLRGIVLRLRRTGEPYTVDDVVDRFLAPAADRCFLAFAYDLVRQLRHVGKGCTADTYTTAVNSFARFRQERDVPLEEVDSALMTAYESYLRLIGVCPNSISFYMRNLRAIYNRAVDKELTVQRYPFKHVYTGIDKTVKRAVPLEVIRQIRDLDLTLHPDMDYARDLFMFSFYTRGMSFVDMAFLKKKDLQNGVLSYRRHKTGQQLAIKWEAPMQEIIGKYDTAGTLYLLPIIKENGEDARKQYKKRAHAVNRNLKKIGKWLELSIPLTTYVTRHGWASIAKSKNIPLATISEAMVHDSENTTRIYLASLDTSMVDKANSLILKSL